jgi:polyphosphate glucokinase
MEVLGLDIGGSGIKAAPVDITKGEFLAERYRLETPQPATPEKILETVEAVVAHFNWKGPIGCGFPSVIKHDTVQTAANIDDSWIGCEVGKMIFERTGCQTHIINDVDAAGLAEMKFGAGKDKKGTTIVLAFGTGIGSAFFTDGELLRNTEFGHIILNNGKEAEVYASNAARKSRDLSWSQWVSRLNKIFRYLDLLLWPDLYIIGGGVVKYHKKFLPDIKSSAEIVPAKLLNHAGIIGSALAYEYAEGHGG